MKLIIIFASLISAFSERSEIFPWGVTRLIIDSTSVHHRLEFIYEQRIRNFTAPELDIQKFITNDWDTLFIDTREIEKHLDSPPMEILFTHEYEEN